jgi:hypothetical protein
MCLELHLHNDALEHSPNAIPTPIDQTLPRVKRIVLLDVSGTYLCMDLPLPLAKYVTWRTNCVSIN